MANNEALEILKRGGRAWNDWLHEKFGSAKDWKSYLESLDAMDICKDLENVILDGYDLKGADLSSANLRGASLVAANLKHADLSAADLQGACLREANLSWASLVEADLKRTDLTQAQLAFSIVSDADVSYAKLCGAELCSTRFGGVKMRGTDLGNADLTGTIFENCDFNDTDVSGALLGSTIFVNVDLRGLRGLATVERGGPSNIAIDTLYRSSGGISEEFLKATGVPEALITYLPSLVSSPMEFYSCFLSHSGKDRLFCDQLSANLRAKNVRVWYFPDDARWGRSVWREIDRSIVTYDKLIVVCSADSLESAPVQREIERALQREDRDKRDILFPVRLDDYLFTKWEHPRKADVIAKVVGDFRGWSLDPQKFIAAFERLIAALEATDR